MRVAITVDPYIPVPPVLYGGIERVVDFVVRGLVARGHRVTLFAHPESVVPCELVPYGVPPHVGAVPRARELAQLGGALWRRRREFDIVFSWGRLASLLPVLPDRRLAKVQRYCRSEVPWASVRRAVQIAGPSVQFAGASASVYSDLPAHGAAGGVWHTLYDGLETDLYPGTTNLPADAPVAFLGRIERIKGTHAAIAIARRAGRRLVIAGNRVDSPEGRAYFDDHVAPHLGGERVAYVGPVDDRQKADLLGSAAALLFPIDWKEAFGIVMAEAMACGTPVLAYPRGSVPEVVRPGVNGFICADEDAAVAALGRLGEIDRAAVRADCVARFDASVVVDRFERVLETAIARLA